jgi:hypothetical protein
VLFVGVLNEQSRSIWPSVLQLPCQPGPGAVQVAVTAKEEAVEVTQRVHQLACTQLVELVADYLDDALSPDLRARFEEHLAGCDGCTTYLSQTQQIIAELRNLSDAVTPEHNRWCFRRAECCS